MCKWSEEALTQIANDLLEASKNKEPLTDVLFKYNFSRIETFENRLLDGIFEIEDETLRAKLIDVISEANNLPIFSTCNLIIAHKCSENAFIRETYLFNKNRGVLRRKFKICMFMINQSKFLQLKMQRLQEQELDNLNKCHGIVCKRWSKI